MTSTEFLSSKGIKTIKSSIPTSSVREYLIEFTKFHVEAALKEASETLENADISESIGIDKESILNSYPLTNIK